MRSPRGTVLGCGTNERNQSRLFSNFFPVDCEKNGQRLALPKNITL
jgi:hypothetical protein